MQKKHSVIRSLLITGVLATGLFSTQVVVAQTAAQQLHKAEQDKIIQQEAEKAKAAEAAFLASPEGQAWMKEREDLYNKQLADEEKQRQEQWAAAEEIMKKEAERLEQEAIDQKAKAEKRKAHKEKLEARRKEILQRNAPKALGCFKDMPSKLPNLTGRDIDGLVVHGPKNSGATCLAYCKAKGFKYAGTQWGKYCHCGNTYGKFGPADNCTKPCTGNSNEMCGGGLANTVYSVDPSETATATAAAPAAAATSEAKWVAGTVPPNATVGAQSGGTPIHICRTAMPNKELHNGKTWKNFCYVGFGGKEIKTPLANSEVLVLANTSWIEVKDGKTPENAFKAGEFGGNPMNICRAKVPNGEVHPGKVWKGNCYVGFGGKEIKTNQFEAMVVTK